MPPFGGHQGGPAPHVNPAFVQPQQHQGPPQSNDMYGNRGMNNAPNQYHGGGGGGTGDGYNRGHGDGSMSGMQISEQEFDEIMNKNRSISSGAISRAVNDAASGACRPCGLVSIADGETK